MAEFQRAFGQPLPRVDGFDKLTGKALYAGDLAFPGMLHLKILRSDRPHAKILGFDAKKAQEVPGVVAVYTSKDIPGRNRVGVRVKDQPVLCDDKVRYIGDPVVLVAAHTLEAAQEAVKLIRVDYEDLPAIFEPEDALATDAINIHETGNILSERSLLKGEPENALRTADILITNTYKTQMVEHAYLEPEAAVAGYRDGKITVWMPSKHVHFDQKEMADVLGLPPEKIRVRLTAIGGSFGDKISLAPGYYAALVSFKTGRPCKMVYTRDESFLVSTKRHPFVIRYQTGATKDGLILVAAVEIDADTGAYASYGPVVLAKSVIHAAGPYEIPNISVKARAIYTNNPIAGAMRGFGVPQVVMAHESQIDILAEILELDPFEIRLKNGLKPGSMTPTSQRLGNSVGFADTVEKIREEVSKKTTAESSGSIRYGWGIASMYYGIALTGLPNPGVSRIEANRRGEFTVYLGCGDVGQGSTTVMAQIAAEVLRCNLERFHFVIGDTDLCLDSGPSLASRLTYVVGRSVQIAAQNLKDLLHENAASILDIAEEDLILDHGFFYPPEAPHRKVSIGEVVKRLEEKGILPIGEGRFDPVTTPLDMETSQGAPYGTYVFATQGALVSADMETGEVKVIEVVACHDVGKAVNPINVAGQIEGGISMGLGYALMEEVLLEDGVIQNPRFSEYLIPTSLDIPNIISLMVEKEEPTGPFGAKGVGEPALLPTVPAILNAIRSATGIRFKEIPITSEKVWEFLRKR